MSKSASLNARQRHRLAGSWPTPAVNCCRDGRPMHGVGVVFPPQLPNTTLVNLRQLLPAMRPEPRVTPAKLIAALSLACWGLASTAAPVRPDLPTATNAQGWSQLLAWQGGPAEVAAPPVAGVSFSNVAKDPLTTATVTAGTEPNTARATTAMASTRPEAPAKPPAASSAAAANGVQGKDPYGQMALPTASWRTRVKHIFERLSEKFKALTG